MNKMLLSIALFFSLTNYLKAQYPLVSIHDLQYIDPQSLSNGVDTSVYYLDTIQVEGIVTFDPCDYGLSTTGGRVGTWLEDPAGGPWSGVHVLIDAAAIGYTGSLNDLNNTVQFIDNFSLGNKIKCTGILNSFGLTGAPVPGNTQVLILPVQSTITAVGQTIPAPPVLSVDQFSLSDGAGGQTIQRETGEQWEGVYVEFDNVQVVDVSYGTGSNTGRIFWSVQDQFGNKVQVRDVSGWIRNDTSDNFCTAAGSNTPDPWDITPYVGATISYIRGQIVEFCSSTTGCAYAISPRDLNDIGSITAAPPITSDIVLSNPVPSTTETQTVSATITDADGLVASAFLYYSVGLGNTTFSPVSMTQNGSTWSGTIPAVSTDSSYVNYWIKATDDDGNHSNYPDSLATNSFYWVINSGINSIKDVQFNPNEIGNPIYAGMWLNDIDVEGIVMATTGFFDLGLVTIQDGEGPWHGIYLRGQNLSSLQRGDKIKITSAKVFENFNVTFLDSTTYTFVSSGNPLYNYYSGLNPDSVRLGAFDQTEAFEGELAGFTNMYVVNQNPDDPSTFGEWSIDNNTSDNIGLRCDDYSNDIGFDFGLDSLSLNQSLDYLYGIMYYSFGNWKLLPRNKNDIAGYHTVTGIEGGSLPGLDAVAVYPNPFAEHFTAVFNLENQETLSIRLTDISGKVLKMYNGLFFRGKNEWKLDASDLEPGIYFLEIRSKDSHHIVKVINMN